MCYCYLFVVVFEFDEMEVVFELVWRNVSEFEVCVIKFEGEVEELKVLVEKLMKDLY